MKIYELKDEEGIDLFIYTEEEQEGEGVSIAIGDGYTGCTIFLNSLEKQKLINSLLGKTDFD